MEQKARDILEFFDEKSFFMTTLRWHWQFSNRAFACLAAQKGVFTFGELIRFLLPVSLSPSKKELAHRFNEFVAHEIKDELFGFLEDGKFSLFGNPFGERDPLGIRVNLMLIYEVVIKDEYHARELLRDDFVVIDAGANIGTFSVLAANLTPKARIYAFEPVDTTYSALRQNTQTYPQITCVPLGLGNEVTSKTIFLTELGSPASVFEDSSCRDHFKVIGKQTAKITTIDALDFPRVDFIKIDTEGYEANIIKGARETIKRHKPIIVMSAYHNPNDKTELPSLLNSIVPYNCGLFDDYGEQLICQPTDRSAGNL